MLPCQVSAGRTVSAKSLAMGRTQKKNKKKVSWRGVEQTIQLANRLCVSCILMPGLICFHFQDLTKR